MRVRKTCLRHKQASLGLRKACLRLKKASLGLKILFNLPYYLIEAKNSIFHHSQNFFFLWIIVSFLFFRCLKLTFGRI